MSRTLVGTYLKADGTAEKGRLLFRPSTAIKNQNTNTLPNPVSVKLVNGEFSITLACTDDEDWSPTGWTWKVTEKIEGGRTFYFELPTGEGEYDIAEVTPLYTAPQVYGAATGSSTDDTKLSITSNLSDVANAATARTNLGLGDAAVKNVGTSAGTVAAGNHTHTADDITGLEAVAVENEAYWDGDSWPARPSVSAGVSVIWLSLQDTAATPPSGASVGDRWYRAPGSTF